MFIVLLLALLGIPVAEIFFIIRVTRDLGIPETIGLLVAVSVAGAWLVRRSGLGVMRQIRERLARGEVPGKELVDGLLILVGGLLMLTPGFPDRRRGSSAPRSPDSAGATGAAGPQVQQETPGRWLDRRSRPVRGLRWGRLRRIRVRHRSGPGRCPRRSRAPRAAQGSRPKGETREQLGMHRGDRPAGQAGSSARTMAAPAASADSLAKATSRDRYFMPQSGAQMSRSAGTYRRAPRIR